MLKDLLSACKSEEIDLLKVLCLKIVGIYKMHIKEINIKNRVFDYFDNLIKAKKLETKGVLINRKY